MSRRRLRAPPLFVFGGPPIGAQHAAPLLARYYDPFEYRFIQEDPAGYAGGSNLYAYVEGAVLSATDPSGMLPTAEGAFKMDGYIWAGNPWVYAQDDIDPCMFGGCLLPMGQEPVSSPSDEPESDQGSSDDVTGAGTVNVQTSVDNCPPCLLILAAFVVEDAPEIEEGLEDLGPEMSDVGSEVTDQIEFDWESAEHIFLDKSGHVDPPTQDMREQFAQLFEQVANNSANLRSDVLRPVQAVNGVQWFYQTSANGLYEVWVRATANGWIDGAGVNLPGQHR